MFLAGTYSSMSFLSRCLHLVVCTVGVLALRLVRQVERAFLQLEEQYAKLQPSLKGFKNIIYGSYEQKYVKNSTETDLQNVSEQNDGAACFIYICIWKNKPCSFTATKQS